MNIEQLIKTCDEAREEAEGVGLSDFLVDLVEIAYNEGFKQGKTEKATEESLK